VPGVLQGQISSPESRVVKINTSLFLRASRSLAVQRNCILIAIATAIALTCSIVSDDYTLTRC
jgi:hypothetical protein